MSAKKVFQTATWGPTKLPTFVMIHRIDVGLAVRVVQEVGRGEAAAEHERLELQTGVEEPEQSQDDLEDPLGPHRAPKSLRPADDRSSVTSTS